MSLPARRTLLAADATMRKVILPSAATSGETTCGPRGPPPRRFSLDSWAVTTEAEIEAAMGEAEAIRNPVVWFLTSPPVWGASLDTGEAPVLPPNFREGPWIRVPGPTQVPCLTWAC